ARDQVLVQLDHGDTVVVADGQQQAGGGDGAHGAPAVQADQAAAAAGVPQPHGPVTGPGGQQQAAARGGGERGRGNPPRVPGQRLGGQPAGERVPQPHGA